MSGGIFDLHVDKALQAGWEVYRADVALFRALFANDGVADSVLNEWHADLVASTVKFRMQDTTGHDPYPLILVKLTEESNAHEGLAGFGGRTGAGVEAQELLINQEVQVFIGTKHPELTRALHVVCQAIMQLAIREFMQGPYRGLQYQGMEAPTPAEELLSEQTGIYIRVQRYKGMVQVAISPTASPPAPLNWFVQVTPGIDEDGTGSDQPGGVVPIVE